MSGELEYRSSRREALAEPVTFTLDGERFTCVSSLGAMQMLDMAVGFDESLVTARAREATSGSENERALLGLRTEVEITMQYLQQVIVEGDWERFAAHVRTHRTELPVLSDLTSGLSAALAGRPTKPPSSSPDGSSPTTEQSSGGSLPSSEDLAQVSAPSA